MSFQHAISGSLDKLRVIKQEKFDGATKSKWLAQSGPKQGSLQQSALKIKGLKVRYTHRLKVLPDDVLQDDTVEMEPSDEIPKMVK